MTSSVSAGDPFVDPVTTTASAPLVDTQPGPAAAPSISAETLSDGTLAVGRNATLTLGTDALIVLDEDFEEQDSSNCCGIWQSGSASTRAIPFYNILWAELSNQDIVIHYAKSVAKDVVRVDVLTYPQPEALAADTARLESWIERLLDRAYGEAQRKKRAKILVNPHSGQGGAEKLYSRDVEPIFSAAKIHIDMAKTRHSGEAVDIAEKIDINAYDMIVSCSGDGLPHEVFNGLGKRPDARKALGKIAVQHIPCGSGNAMSCNINGTASASLAALAIVKGIPTPLDLISITQGTNRTISFLSQAVGIVAESDLATEHLRWMGGARFTYGFLVRLFTQKLYPCDLAVKVAIEDKTAIREHYKQEMTNHEPASERRGPKPLLDDDASASSGGDDGLPALRYGTINDKLPEGWELIPYDNLGNFYCGNMSYMAADANFFAPALPNDGCMDLVCIDGDIGRLSQLKLLAAVGDGKFFDQPLVSYRKVLAYRIIPKNQTDGYISIDGERVPFAPFQAEVHRGLGTVLTKSGHMYEAPGPHGIR